MIDTRCHHNKLCSEHTPCVGHVLTTSHGLPYLILTSHNNPIQHIGPEKLTT